MRNRSLMWLVEGISHPTGLSSRVARKWPNSRMNFYSLHGLSIAKCVGKVTLCVWSQVATILQKFLLHHEAYPFACLSKSILGATWKQSGSSYNPLCNRIETFRKITPSLEPCGEGHRRVKFHLILPRQFAWNARRRKKRQMKAKVEQNSENKEDHYARTKKSVLTKNITDEIYFLFFQN